MDSKALPSLMVFTTDGREELAQETHTKIKKTKSNTVDDPGKLKLPSGKKQEASTPSKLSDKLTSAEMEVLQNVFAMFDKDKDGLVSTKDLGSLMRMLGQNPTDNEINSIIKKAHTSVKEHMNFEEFTHLILKNGKSKQDMENSLMEAFRLFDRNGDGCIDKQELKLMLQNLGEDLSEDDLNQMFNEFDVNSDGKIDYTEFSKAMTADSLLPSIK